ncbi:serine-rich adhesin for platelets-like [Acropora muricata]|uniref:serine-rich adhesin for platelets-like n=1 Tax=Acropora muricata TaxID=159855 RepID=UPI0034E3E0EF
MESLSMETEESVIDGRVETPVDEKPVEVTPVQVCETRVQTPEMEKLLDQPVNTLDVTKLSYEVQQGYRVFVEMSGDSYKNVTWPFMEPVDAEALGLWDYHEKIKEPMSLHQIGCKFNKYEYNSITEVIADIRLILENCYRYNGANHWVSKLGHKMEKILEQKLALLNRSLRDKVSLEATMTLKNDFVTAAVPGEGMGRRRTVPRVSYNKMINGEESSSLLTHLKIQEDIEERERRRVREKEKKEANLVLLQDLAEWEEKELGADVMKQLHSLWEIPSLASLLFLLKDCLYIPDLSITELELSFVYANKSSLLARIYTALLVTPHQRKSLFKKPPMKFKVWESKLCERMNIWYKAAEKDGQELICHQYGLDMALFDVLGDLNPLSDKSYMDLTLHQRVWILKCLCDNSLVRDYDVREHLAYTPATDQRELLLGYDRDNWSYVYFPIFSSTDLRVYKQCPLEFPAVTKRKKKITPPTAPPPPLGKTKMTPARPATPTQVKRNSRLRKLREVTPSPEPETASAAMEEEDATEPKNSISEGFELVAYDIETLQRLCEQFDEPPLPPKKRGRKPKPPPPRKKCEVDLHQTLCALFEDLEKYEVSFSKLLSKAKIKIMKESQEPEPEEEPEEIIQDEEEELEEWGSEGSIGDEIQDAGAQNMSSDEDFVLETEEHGKNSKAPETKTDHEQEKNKGVSATPVIMIPQKRKAELENSSNERKQFKASAHPVNESKPCSISIQTTPLKIKKQKKTTDVKSTSTGVSQAKSSVVPQVSSVIHVPSGLRMVKDGRVSVGTARSGVSTANTNTVTGTTLKTLTSGGVLVVASSPSGNINQANSSTFRIHPKLPVILNKAGSATVPKVKSTVAEGTSNTASKNISPTASATQQSPAQLAATLPGIGKVMFVTSTGVPLQVLRAVPVSKQSLLQGISVTLGSTTSSSPVQVVSSSSGQSSSASAVARTSNSTSGNLTSTTSSPSTTVPVQLVKQMPASCQPIAQIKTSNTDFAVNSNSSSSSLPASTRATVPLNVLNAALGLKSTSGQAKLVTTVTSNNESSSHNVSLTSLALVQTGAVQPSSSSSPVQSTGPQTPSSKVVLSVVAPNAASKSSTSQPTSNVMTTSASPVNPAVILLRHPVTGGVMPVTLKGGTVVVTTPSTTQQVVLIRNSNVVSSSSTTNAVTVVSSLGGKVVLSPSVSSTKQGVFQCKPKISSILPASKPLDKESMTSLAEGSTSTADSLSGLINSTAQATLPITKEITSTTTLGSNLTALVKTEAHSKPTSCSNDEQFATKTNTSAQASSSNGQPCDEELNRLYDYEVSHAGDANQTLLGTTKPSDKVTITTAAIDSRLRQINLTKTEENVQPSKTISPGLERTPGSNIDNEKLDLSKKGKVIKNSGDLSLDLTCYETSVGDSTGCEESDDSAPNGRCREVLNNEGKLCNGIACAVSQTNSPKENKVDCRERNIPAKTDQISNGILVTKS